MLVPFDEIFAGKQLQTAQARLQEVIGQYRETLDGEHRHLFDGYRFVDAAHKVVGVGSVGTRAWVVLFVGRDEEDPLFLQVKEAGPSVLEPFTAPSEFPHQGQRVVEGQRLTQAEQRHHARLAHRRSARTRRSATSTCASSGIRRDRPSSSR